VESTVELVSSVFLIGLMLLTALCIFVSVVAALGAVTQGTVTPINSRDAPVTAVLHHQRRVSREVD
jgi:hypothetical protein